MCSAAFYYPADRIFQASKHALLREGFRILEENARTGYLKAKSKYSIFKKGYFVELKIVSQDSISTLNLSAVNSFAQGRDERQQFEHERSLIDTVYKMIRARDVN